MSSNDESTSQIKISADSGKKKVIFLRLTDASLKALEEYAANEKRFSEKVSLRLDTDSDDGKPTGELNIPRRKGKNSSFSFAVSSISQANRQGTVECVKFKKHRKSQSASHLGFIKHQFNVRALEEDTFKTTKHKIKQVKLEESKQSAKTLGFGFTTKSKHSGKASSRRVVKKSSLSNTLFQASPKNQLILSPRNGSSSNKSSPFSRSQLHSPKNQAPRMIKSSSTSVIKQNNYANKSHTAASPANASLGARNVASSNVLAKHGTMKTPKVLSPLSGTLRSPNSATLGTTKSKASLNTELGAHKRSRGFNSQTLSPGAVPLRTSPAQRSLSRSEPYQKSANSTSNSPWLPTNTSPNENSNTGSPSMSQSDSVSNVFHLQSGRVLTPSDKGGYSSRSLENGSVPSILVNSLSPVNGSASQYSSGSVSTFSMGSIDRMPLSQHSANGDSPSSSYDSAPENMVNNIDTAKHHVRTMNERGWKWAMGLKNIKSAEERQHLKILWYSDLPEIEKLRRSLMEVSEVFSRMREEMSSLERGSLAYAEYEMKVNEKYLFYKEKTNHWEEREKYWEMKRRFNHVSALIRNYDADKSLALDANKTGGSKRVQVC